MRLMRWVLTIFVALMMLMSVVPWLKRFGFGRLPGDLNFTVFGREIHLPFASTILLSLAAMLVARLV